MLIDSFGVVFEKLETKYNMELLELLTKLSKTTYSVIIKVLLFSDILIAIIGEKVDEIGNFQGYSTKS